MLITSARNALKTTSTRDAYRRQIVALAPALTFVFVREHELGRQKHMPTRSAG